MVAICHCTWAFSSCCQWGLLFAAARRLLNAVGSPPQAPGARVSGVAAHWLGSCGAPALVAPQRVRSPWIRDRSNVPCIARQILNHWTIREALFTKKKKKKRKNRQVSDNLLSLGEAACFFLFIWLLWILVVACGIDPDQGSNPGPLHWECRDTTTGSQGESLLLTLLL